VWDARAVTTTKDACFDMGSWLDDVLGIFLDESLGDGDAHGRRFPY
jgi:hypothetical protein